jgi:hypothetical protein
MKKILTLAVLLGFAGSTAAWADIAPFDPNDPAHKNHQRPTPAPEPAPEKKDGDKDKSKTKDKDKDKSKDKSNDKKK